MAPTLNWVAISASILRWSRPSWPFGQNSISRYFFSDSLASVSLRPVTVATLEDVAAADGRPTARPEQALEIQEVYATIAQLPEDFRLALVAVDVLGLSYREAARALLSPRAQT